MADTADYTPPKVWTWDKESGGRFANINRPIAGPTKDKALPVGRHPLQLYSLATPNGIKVTVMLEELLALGHSGAEYDAWLIRINDADQFGSGFVAVNPNSKIPALMDHSGSKPIRIFESGAILIYLAEKTGKLMGTTPAEKYQTIQWLMFQMGGVGPMFGQLGFFVKFAGAAIEDPRPRERYIAEAKRLLAVLEKQLTGRDWLTGSFSIADIATAPWVNGLDFYGARPLVGWDDLPNLQAYLTRFYARPAVQKGMKIPAAA